MKNIKKFTAILLASTAMFSTVYAYNYSLNAGKSYSHEALSVQTRTGWMDWLNDKDTLSELSIPGTNDSLMYNSAHSDQVLAQTMTIDRQLQSGIRAFEIGYSVDWLTDKVQPTYDGVVLDAKLNEPIEIAMNFLKENPREIVFVHYYQEDSVADEKVIKNYFNTMLSPYKAYIYAGGSQNPTVAEMRGKIVLLSSNEHEKTEVERMNVSLADGVTTIYANNFQGNLQESYVASNAIDTYKKWELTKATLLGANQSDKANNDVVYMNNLGGYNDDAKFVGPYGAPYSVASGYRYSGTKNAYLSTGLSAVNNPTLFPDFPRINGTIHAKGMNPLTAEYIEKNKVSYTGFVMADFPGQDLINAIISANER